MVLSGSLDRCWDLLDSVGLTEVTLASLTWTLVGLCGSLLGFSGCELG
jgi:hypothetical protein